MATEATTRRFRAAVSLADVHERHVASAFVVGVIEFVATWAGSQHGEVRHPWAPVAVVLLAAGPVALVVKRRYPAAVLAVTQVTALAYLVLGYGRGPMFLGLVVALLNALASGRRRAAIATLIAGFVGFAWLGPLFHHGRWPSLIGVLGLAAWLLVLYAAGEAIRVRRVRAAERAQVRAADARRKMSEERLRFARELHDVLAHNISLINVQAATTLHRAERSEQGAYEALATIKKVSQDTLVELRSLLSAMRETDEAAPRAPAPSLARLDDLVVSAASAGVTARVEVRGERRGLPASVDLAAYRIVQEALTNVARHAGTGAAAVVVDFGPAAVMVQVDDDGPCTVAVVPGTGITGMTERAGALGGTLQAGPRPGGGFRVQAWLPAGEAG
jgi:signal transduction histidine kinase